MHYSITKVDDTRLSFLYLFDLLCSFCMSASMVLLCRPRLAPIADVVNALFIVRLSVIVTTVYTTSFARGFFTVYPLLYALKSLLLPSTLFDILISIYWVEKRLVSLKCRSHHRSRIQSSTRIRRPLLPRPLSVLPKPLKYAQSPFALQFR